MGNRAVVVFTDATETEFSPNVYLHWGGDGVPGLLAKLATLMRGREGDVSYSCARFIGLVHAQDPESNTSLGVSNTSAATSATCTRCAQGTRACSW